MIISDLFDEAVKLHMAGKNEAAIAIYQRVLEHEPNYSPALGNLAVLEKAQGRYDIAENLLNRAIRANPRNTAALTTLANLHLVRKQFDAAYHYATAVLEIEPNHANALLNLGVALVHRKQIDKAEEVFEKALQLEPNDINARLNLANCHWLLRKNLEQSLQIMEEVVAQDPENHVALNCLAVAYREHKRPWLALQTAMKATALHEDEDYLSNLGNILVDFGDFNEGAKAYRKALNVDPYCWAAYDNLLFSLNYNNHLTGEEVYKEYQAYNEAVTKATKFTFKHSPILPIDNRRIRIGYSSPDFRGHACRFFLEPILSSHDRTHFELYAYANLPDSDSHTERFKGYFDYWIDVARMNDAEMAQRIFDDKIDILIDLAGHTGGNRLLVFAMRPAPIQVSYLGYGYTTGLKAIDYFISDSELTPKGCENVFSEKIWRIDSPHFCYHPPKEITPLVGELPALRNGFITFGSLTRTVRLNDQVFKAWKQILDRVTGSKLRLDQKIFSEEASREIFWQRLENLGIPRERVNLTYSNPHWNVYNEIDITLDAYPHNSGTTIFESLWMGVPVLSKQDRPSVGCVGASILRPLKLNDWVAYSEESYIDKAVSFASNLQMLQEVRQMLRLRMESNSLFNSNSFTRKLERAYREMILLAQSNQSEAGDANQLLLQAHQQWQEGNYIDAKNNLQRVLEKEPNQPDAWHLKGIIALIEKDLTASLEYINKAIALQSNFAEFYVTLARCFIANNNIQEAFDSLDKALCIEPDKKNAKSLREALFTKINQDVTNNNSDKKFIVPRKLEKELKSIVDTAFKLHQAGNLKGAENGYKKALSIYPNHFAALKFLGTCLLQQERSSEACNMLEKASQIYDKDAELFDHLGTCYANLGKKIEAFNAYSHSVKLNPNSDAVWNNLGMLYKERNENQEAESCYKKALSINPKMVEALNNYGNLLMDIGCFDEAENLYHQLISVQPTYPFVYLNLGNLKKNQNQPKEAEALYRKALTLKNNLLEALFNLSIVLCTLRRFEEAKDCALKALEFNPKYAQALNQLGIILVELDNPTEAEECYKKSIALNPNYAEAYNNYGVLLSNNKRWEESKNAYLKALEIRPDYAVAWSNLGGLSIRWKRQHEAIAYYQKALEIKPDYAEAVSNLAMIYQDLSDLPKAIDTFRNAISIDPTLWHIRDNLLFASNYDERLSGETLYQEYERYGLAVTNATTKIFEHSQHISTSNRRIRIGYSSPDFRGHACRFFLEPILSSHDRTRFELYAYANLPEHDLHTERFKSYFDYWVDVARMNDEEMAQRIFDDKIDILIDLAGHTGGNRLLSFAMRPAPIQASYLGYGYTTGLKEVDYFIGDYELCPAGCEKFFSENIWRIESPHFCYHPPREITPSVGELPALNKGYITFGCLTRTVRLNNRVFLAWKQILENIPKSRLHLDQKVFVEEATREMFWQRLELLGIPRDRIDLSYTHPHWDAYREIDITLDAYPHNSGTTILESLWMGVPVLSKRDRPSVGCVGASILRPMQLDDWIAEDEVSYIKKAIGFASNLQQLSQLRQEMRQRMEVNALLNAENLTKKLESAYIEMINKAGL